MNDSKIEGKMSRHDWQAEIDLLEQMEPGAGSPLPGSPLSLSKAEWQQFRRNTDEMRQCFNELMRGNNTGGVMKYDELSEETPKSSWPGRPSLKELDELRKGLGIGKITSGRPEQIGPKATLSFTSDNGIIYEIELSNAEITAQHRPAWADGNLVANPFVIELKGESDTIRWAEQG